MKAIVLRSFGSADNFVAADLPIPEVRAGEVRVRVKAAGFNPVDHQIRKGQPESTGARSMILGRDMSGTIDAVHESVTDLSLGDDVFGYVCNLASSGTYAEYVSVPAELMARKPASLTHAQAAAVPVAAITAGIALRKAGAAPDKSLFVAGGAGGVGTMAIRLAQHLGVRHLFTTAGNETSRRYLVETCGLRDEQVIDYRQTGFVEQAIERSGARFDAVIDLVGGRMLAACCALLALDGKLASTVEAPSRDDFETLFERNASFHSVGAHAYSLTPDRDSWRTYRALLEELASHFDSGALAPPPIRILGGLTADVVRQAHSLMESNAVQGKLVMTCDAAR